MKTITSKVMTAVIQSDYGIETDSFVHRYPDWIKIGLDIIEIPKLKSKYFQEIQVKDGIAKLPCNIGVIDAVLIKSSCGCGYKYLSIKNSEFPLSCIDTAFNTKYEGEFIRKDKLKTNFKEGTIYIAWQEYVSDSNGFPLIPDDGLVREALGYFILQKILLSGYKHPTLRFVDALQLWNDIYPRASNHINWFTPQEADKFIDMWLNINKSLIQ